VALSVDNMAIRFQTNPRKALEVIVWFANKRPGIDFHSILKLLFFADKDHLNEWGRPIVGDRYNALQYGPVAQMTYDILKRDPLALEELKTASTDLPFEVQNSYCVYPHRAPDLDRLSETDVDALEAAWERYAHLDFKERTDESHRHPAYRNAELAGRQTMSYADFLEGEMSNPEVIADLEETGPRLRL
jgi:uncharacterized phage-associated protein